jgi:hypothetical protein
LDFNEKNYFWISRCSPSFPFVLGVDLEYYFSCCAD